ncbi:NitT/TauT family transport system substrate-binding protein [Branchiibius hedensis]|uniref:NitT/TauT family transport system substrate-binding protein n=1 Tax=Branchiibius hedensis TaxID=672460 RepID=A0A2Y9C168_9MICO|nr:ABC transporter substrate-binding protein [Branchiibius hedensis]PWJ25018.1 NitT/TauT family transport system substrate-binding protein [Branchiibius hedensis]SSA33833.1 NitT/TauT family transport system substrate-binding protein [Branchiibius hedensis]
MTTVQRGAIAATIVGLSSMLAACGGGAAGSPTAQGAGSDSGQLRTLVVGVSPSTAALSVGVAQQQGMFKKHGLNVQLKTVQSGAEAIPQLLKGDLDVSLGDTVGTFNAASNGVALRAFAVATVAPSDPAKDFSAIMAKPGITTAADLSGRTIAVNQAGGSAELFAKAAIDKAGGDSSKVKVVELAFPQMVQAVQADRVDAAVLVEPFVAAGQAAGLTTVLRPQAAGIPGLASNLFVASAQEVAAKKSELTDFVAALNDASGFLTSNKTGAYAAAAAWTKQPLAKVEKTRLPTYPQDAGDLEPIKGIGPLMVKYGLLKQDPDLSQILAPVGS